MQHTFHPWQKLEQTSRSGWVLSKIKDFFSCHDLHLTSSWRGLYSWWKGAWALSSELDGADLVTTKIFPAGAEVAFLEISFFCCSVAVASLLSALLEMMNSEQFWQRMCFKLLKSWDWNCAVASHSGHWRLWMLFIQSNFLLTNLSNLSVIVPEVGT